MTDLDELERKARQRDWFRVANPAVILELIERVRKAEAARVSLNELLEAIDAGTVKIDGPMIDGGGNPEIGYEQWPWAGEWLHHARKATAP